MKRVIRNRKRIQFQESLEPRILLAGDLIAQWRAEDLSNAFDDGQAIPEWVDSVASIKATAEGSPSLNKGSLGRRAAVSFDVTDQKDSFSIGRIDNPTSKAREFSVAVLFSTSTTNLQGNGDRWHDGSGLVQANQLGFGHDWGISLHANGVAAAGIGGGFGAAPTSVFGNTPLNDGAPHVVIFSNQSGNISMIVDNTDPLTASGPNTSARDSLIVDFGVNSDRLGQFEGEIAEIRFYNGALTATEASAVYDDIMAFYGNQPPTSVDDKYQVNEDQVLFVGIGEGVLKNDTDADSDTLSAELVSEPQHGEIGFLPDGSFIYDPRANVFGTDTFTYVARDFGPSEPATVTIEITPTYDPPRPQPDAYKSVPGRRLTIPGLVGVLENDSNIDQSPLTAVLDQAPAFGNLQLNADGGFTFDPLNSFGSTTFTYRIDDGVGLSEPAAVTLTINSAPVANDDEFVVAEDTLLQVGIAAGILANDTDAEADTLTATILTEPQNGQLGISSDGSFIYDPHPNFFGTDSFTYQISDGVDHSSVATATLSITAVNDAPVAVDDAYFVAPDQRLTLAAIHGVLTNDSDIEQNALSVSLESEPQWGKITLNADGSFTYEPAQDFAGEDRFTYRVTDAGNAAATAEVVLFVGDAPIQITEFMAANATTLVTRTRDSVDDRFRGETDSPDWVELRNETSVAIDISGFHLTDDADNPALWGFPDGTSIPAAGYLVVFLTGISLVDPDLDENGFLHTGFKLNAEGDYLALTTPEGIVLDEIDAPFPRQVADVSYGLTDAGFLYQPMATPGEANAADGLPGIAEVASVSVPAGYFDAPIQVAISTETPTATIRYTLDGSDPTLTNGMEYRQPIDINSTTLLRTKVFKDGLLASRSTTQSYLYLDEVLTQPDNPTGFPSTWGRAGASDYGIDPRIATDTRSQYYDADLRAALQSHDAISIVTDMDHLFDRDSGIYTNPQRDGVAWERPTSMELISSEGTQLLQINAGLRIQGAASRNPNRPKHNMRFLFKEQYGSSKLEYPFFAESDIQTIDTLILRGGNGDSWFHPSANQQNQAQYIRDQWHKETQRLMGHTYVPQRYLHLFINGLYWGLYHTFEKPNAAFFAERFGGEPEEYDVLQHQNGIVDGTRDSWNNIMQIARAGLESNEAFEQIKQEVDIPDLMDYLLLNSYSGNVDWDQNNWFGGRKREGGQFRFFTWDAERTFLGTRDNRVTAINANQPTDLHRRLQDNDEYRLLFADHVHKHFFNDGLLTPQSAEGRWLALADEIELPLTAEAARWGDNKRSGRPYTADVEWKRELDRLVSTYFPTRTETVLNQLNRRDLYPDAVAPSFNQHGGTFDAEFQLAMSAPEGIIYYTTDGSDPRLIGGEISPNAMMYADPISLTDDTTVNSRVLLDGEWSALNEATFLSASVPASADTLRVSEINYNPAQPTAEEIAASFDNNGDFEFLELTNISRQTVDLSSVKFVLTDDRGIEFDFSFADITRLSPGSRVLIVEDADAFAFRYGDQLPVAGEWSGRLSNAGEEITIVAGAETIQQFTYDDSWYPSTDGGGSTLEVIDVTSTDLGRWSEPAGWRASAPGGSPGTGPDAVIPGDSNHDGIFNSSDMVAVFVAGEYEDGIAGNSTFEEGDWNGDGDFDSRDLVFVFQAGTFVAEARVLREAESKLASDDFQLAAHEEKMQDPHAEKIVEKTTRFWARNLKLATVDLIFEDLDQDSFEDSTALEAEFTG